MTMTTFVQKYSYQTLYSLSSKKPTLQAWEEKTLTCHKKGH